MKKKTIFRLIVAVATILFYQATNNVADAQGAYVIAGGGYNLSAASMTLGFNSTSSSETVISGTFGKGISFGAGFGYMFSANLGAELGISYLAGSTYTSTDAQVNQYPYYNGSTSKIKGKMLRLIPAIKLTAGDKLKPYAKFGLVVGLMPKVDEDGSLSFIGSSSTSTDRYSGGTSIGWTGALGIDFNFSAMFGIYLELNSINQSWAPGKDEYTYSHPDYDPLTGLTITTTESGTKTFVKTKNYSASNNQELKGHLPFSSFGVNAGIKISFGGGAAAVK